MRELAALGEGALHRLYLVHGEETFLVERVLKALLGGHSLSEAQISDERQLIVVAHDLSPADMIIFKRHRFGGFVTDVGGVTSHTATDAMPFAASMRARTRSAASPSRSAIRT